MDHQTNYRGYFDKIKTLEPRTRGTEFEGLINRIFEDSNLLLTPRFRTSDTQQEIDGAVLLYNKVFLLEAKWEETDTLAASKLFSFLGKINSKLIGTLGIFISYNELKSNFLDAVRNGLRQNCFLIHGPQNIEDIIDKKIDIKEYLEYCFLQASIKNRVSIDTSEFILLPKRSVSSNSLKENNSWDELFKGLTGSEALIDFASRIEKYYRETSQLSEKIVNIFSTIEFTTLTKSKFDKLVEKLVSEEKENFVNAIIQKFKGETWQSYSDESFCELLQKYNLQIVKQDRILIIENTTKEFNGDYNLENKASNVINIFYKSIELDELELLAKKFLFIYCDSFRKEKFSQKKLANRIFSDLKEKKGEYYSALEAEIKTKAKTIKYKEMFFGVPDIDPKVNRRMTEQRIKELFIRVFIDNSMDPDKVVSGIYDTI